LLKAIGTGLSGDLGVDVTANEIPSVDLRSTGIDQVSGSFILSSSCFRHDYMITVASQHYVNIDHLLVIGGSVPELIRF
jgi:hypothetical protein